MNPMKELQKGKGIGFWVKEGMMEYNKIDHGNNIFYLMKGSLGKCNDMNR